MKTAIQMQNDVRSSLNRIAIVFNRVVDPKNSKAISEFREEKDRIREILENKEQWKPYE